MYPFWGKQARKLAKISYGSAYSVRLCVGVWWGEQGAKVTPSHWDTLKFVQPRK